MSAVPSLTWPGSRVLAGWWPLLERRRPHGLWIIHLLLHRVEALVAVSGSPLLDQLNRLLLEALTLSSDLDGLALDGALLSRLLFDLESANLVCRVGERRTLTAEGRRVLEEGRPVCTRQERRTFHFLDAESPRYLSLEHPPCESWAGGPEWRFDPQVLRTCLNQGEGWKQAHTFPQDVQSLVEEGPEWRRVIVDRPERLTILGMAVEDRFLGFAVQSATWQIQDDNPVLSLGSTWQETLPELTGAATMDDWRQAWRAWGQPRGLPVGELEACHLEPEGIRLRVRAPRPLIERLRAARSDALKGEAWLMAGATERVRVLALIDLREEA